MKLDRLTDSMKKLKNTYEKQVNNFEVLFKMSLNDFNNYSDNEQIEVLHEENNQLTIGETFDNQVIANCPVITESAELIQLNEIRKFIDVDLKENVIFVQFRGSLGENDIEFSSLPNEDQLRDIQTVNLISAHARVDGHCMRALKGLWTLLTQVSKVIIHFSCSFNDDDLTMLSSDPFWATEKLTHFGLINSSGVEQDIENLEPLNETQSKVNLSDFGLKAFSSTVIQRLKQVSFLAIDLGHTNISDDGLDPLVEEVNKISSNLSAFTLGLNFTNIKNQAVLRLAQGFCYDKLETFGLFLGGCKNVATSSIQVLCSRMTDFAERCKAFILNLQQTKLNTSISYLAEDILKKTTILKRLEILFDGLHLDDDNLITLFTHIRNNAKTLKKLRLGLSKTQISDESIEHLATLVIPAMSCLRSFSLGLDDNMKITDDSLQYLCINLEELMKNIEAFFLNVRHTEVTGENLEGFVGMILANVADLIQLKHFEIYLDEKNGNVNVQTMLEQIYIELANKMESLH